MYHSTDISFSIISLGCSKNQVDAEKLQGGLVSAGFSTAEDTESADILIINTCGFITPAKEESISVILDALAIKENRDVKTSFPRRVAVTGCLSKRYFDDLAADMPEVDLLYGLLDEEFIPALAHRFDITLDSAMKHDQVPLIRGLAYRYIKISEGCSNNCSYCAIPLIRGPLKCFRPEDILEDVKRAAADGAREINLISQDTSLYQSGDTGLPELMGMVSEVPGVEWIRILYCHPDHVTPEIIEAIGSIDKVVPYIDLPFQHVSTDILRSMGREGSYDRYRDLVRELRSRVPGICIRSTFMTGYPGETGRDFKELLAFLSEMKLDRVGAFPFSPEEDTPAALMDGQVSPSRAKKRYDRLMALQQKISENRLMAMIGSEVTVLIEEQIDENTWVGRTEFDAPEVDGVFYLTGSALRVNSIVTATVTDAVEYDLIGEVS